jgi:hypothetical protein
MEIMAEGIRIESFLPHMPVTRGRKEKAFFPLRSYSGRSPDLQISASAAFPRSESLRSGMKSIRNLFTVTKFVQDFHPFPFSTAACSSIDSRHLNVKDIISCTHRSFNFLSDKKYDL